MSDLGLFGPGSVTWRVHAEPILMLAGLRALFLQSLHPRALAGVLRNSGYKRDPWGRLMRTINYVATVIYGTTEQARAAGARVRAIHARLGVDEPDLLLWVHVTEVESFVDTARRAGLKLTDAEVDTYLSEQRRAAELVGLDPSTVPGTQAQLRDYYRRVRPELAMTKDAAETLAFLWVPPLPWYLTLSPVRVAYTGAAATAFGLMPAWARRMYGAPGLSTTDITAGITVRTLRTALGALPHSVFEGPLYRAAMERSASMRTASAPSTVAMNQR
ncbi:oxygenase MpaB family protein [Allorhizocola rhizosphaerae]|uniref:oxygenase MpaB family protein n=1 Tax=Allorhizocola rhizosphaerae TaxID=1872709 RepID=UPI000E3E5739|nr:oxygenase MpaB family protein [Allorhizocola rhizosphaerae]